jgi:type I restriction enzyme, S subunit
LSSTEVHLGNLIRRSSVRRAGNTVFPILSMTMHRGLVDQGDKFKKRVASLDTSQYRIVSKNQLVVGFPIDEGVLSIQRLYDEAIVSPAYNIWDVIDATETFPPYLERFLRSPRALRFYESKLRGTTARRRTLPDDIFLKLPVPLPPASEQRWIADLLDRADVLRTKRLATIAQLDTLTQAIFLDMFGDPETNPRGWPREQLGELSDRITKGESPAWQGYRYQDSGALFVTSENVRLGQIDLANPKFVSVDFHHKLSRSKLRDGDLLVNLVGASIGRSCLFTGWSGPANINQAVAVITLRSGLIDPVFLVNLLTVDGGQRLILSNRVEAARANISLSDLRKLPIPIPPIPLQLAFVNRANHVASVRNAVCSSLAQLDCFFASLQYRAFRGEL